MKKICPYLGGFESECYKLIDAFWDDLWKAAMSNVGVKKQLISPLLVVVVVVVVIIIVVDGGAVRNDNISSVLY